ncbi:hypothetical protein NUW54_g3205 [Trametes sanguinea]|uniref:Uncharacterized protein n=1 Tax=Trametes sanguinea TaxID=158606 RepID=A0ACC1Q478_9APHY|nr:hypothetical protein NUW54_g3205 [Trametes sanguinea]
MAVHHSEGSAGSPGRPVPPPPPARKAPHAAPPPPPVRPRVHSETDGGTTGSTSAAAAGRDILLLLHHSHLLLLRHHLRRHPLPGHSAAPTAPPPPPPPGPSPARSRTSSGSNLRPSSLPASRVPSGLIPKLNGNGNGNSEQRRKSKQQGLRVSCYAQLADIATVLVPTPPPTVGSHTFPVSGFPPPRPFTAGVKKYAGGRQRGCNFDLGSL